MDRKASITRQTRETSIQCTLELDGNGTAEIQTPVGFLTHMLETWTRHAGVNLVLKASGDIQVDYHHTVEDTGIVIGEAIRQSLGEKRGIQRFGWAIVPLDEALSMVAVDLGGRPFLVMDVEFQSEKTGDLPVDLWTDFFQALSVSAGMNIHIRTFYGRSDHHKIESVFKAFARSFAMAIGKSGGSEIPSTKGVL